MIRRIECEEHGQVKPMHPEDYAMGWKRRFVPLEIIHADLRCDTCAMNLAIGTKAVAVTQWRESNEGEPLTWEDEYGRVL